MTPPTYKTLLVEDEQWVRKSLAKKIADSGLGFVISGEATNGQAALELMEDISPDLLVTDIRMPVMDGLELIRNVSFSRPGTKVIIISGFSDFEYAQQAIKYRVSDFLLKPVSAKDMAAVLQSVRIQLDAERRSEAGLTSTALLSDQEEIAHVVEVYIRENFRKDISLGEISQKLGITTDYLSKAFKKHRGETPLKHIITLRMNEAKRLLVEQAQLDIYQIGERVGYRDQYYFSRIFKTYVGLYPTEYRAATLRDGGEPVTSLRINP